MNQLNSQRTITNRVENCLACEHLPAGTHMTADNGHEVRHLFEAKDIFGPSSLKVPARTAKELFREAQKLGALSLAFDDSTLAATLRVRSVIAPIAREELFLMHRYCGTSPSSDIDGGHFDAISVRHRHRADPIAGPLEQLNELMQRGSARYVGIELIPSIDSLRQGDFERLCDAVHFISVRTDDFIAHPDIWASNLQYAARAGVSILCHPVHHPLFALTSNQFDHHISRWLRGVENVPWNERPLRPDLVEDRALVHRIQEIHQLCQTYGEDMFTISLKFPQLFQPSAFVSASTSREELNNFQESLNAAPSPVLWQAFKERGWLPAAMDTRPDLGRSSGYAGPELITISEIDSVAFATRTLPYPGICSDSHSTISLQSTIPAGHLLLRRDHAAGTPVFCYGSPIGTARTDLIAGTHITSESLTPLPILTDPMVDVVGLAKREFPSGEPVRWNDLKREIPIEVSTVDWKAPPEQWKANLSNIQREFFGYRRSTGRAGVRQYIAVISQVGCTESMTESYLPALRKQLKERYPQMDLVPISHGLGCSQTENATRILPGLINRLADNDNVGAIVWMGLGCQQLQQDSLVQLTSSTTPAAPRKPERWIVAQNVRSEYKLLRDVVMDLGDELGEQRRVPVSVGDLMSFVECGGSDGFSGITANPLVGRVSRILASLGATVMIGETTELPAQHFLEWSASPEVAAECLKAKMRYNRYLSQFGGDERFNPVRGNKEGGISTALHKALGAAQKIAGIPVRECIPYGGASTRHLEGVSFVDATSNDPRSVTARVMAGATLGFFTSGRMTPWGSSIAPTIKVATNSERARLKSDWVDFDAGRMISEGASIDDLADELFKLTLRVANGALTQSERLGTTGLELWVPDSGFQ